MATAYRSSNGFLGVRVVSHSTITMPPGSNTIEGNGKVGSGREQVTEGDSCQCISMIIK